MTAIFSYVFMTWLSPLIWRLFRHQDKPVEESEIWQCSDENGVKVNMERIKHLWQNELDNYGNKGASFFRVWIKFIRIRLLSVSIIMVVLAVSEFLSSAFLVNLILSYIEEPNNELRYGICLVVAMLFCDVVRACSFSVLMVYGSQTGVRFRNGMIGLMFDKLLKLRTFKETANTEIINAFVVDSYRVYIGSQSLSLLLSFPIYLIIGTVYCYLLIGRWCLIAIGSFVIASFVQTSLTHLLTKLRRKCVQYTDKRVKSMLEILNSIRFIKMYAWERPFRKAIEVLRQQERKYLLYGGIVYSITSTIIPSTPTVVSVITLGMYTAAGNYLTAPIAFAVIGTLNFLRGIVTLMPLAMRTYGDARVSFDKVKRILTLEEYVLPSPDYIVSANAIEITTATFAWDKATDEANQRNKMASKGSSLFEGTINAFTISNISMEIRQGQLIGICGPVGSGKSSLMSAFVGRMPLLEGHLAVNGRVAYVTQQAWLFNDTVKNNILFGLEYDANRYKQVISGCCLEEDFDAFIKGDETEIGERGANLSGGQRQRMNLARAVYSNSDIYILDDPLSALDVRVGKEIFHSCIMGMLKDKTVLLVTHQFQYFQHCDEVVVMQDGRIVEKGQHVELLQKNDGLYSRMYTLSENTTMKSNHNKEMGNFSPEEKSQPYALQDGEKLTGNVTNIQENEAKNNGKLVVEEDIAVGAIKFSVYKAYIKAVGGKFVFCMVLVLYFITAGSLVFSDWWLSKWIDSGSEQLVLSNTTSTVTAHQYYGSTEATEDTTTWKARASLASLDYETYFLVYVASLAGIVILQVVESFTIAKVTIQASNTLHANCLERVLKAPMSFFDANPVGRILNRFSKMLDESDVFLPRVVDPLLQIVCLIILTFAMLIYITPWTLLVIVPTAILLYILKHIATVSVRQLKRLENVVLSPLISHVNMTLQGLPTITAYGQQKNFYERCVKLGNTTSMAIYLVGVSKRWSALRIDLVASCITLGSSLIFILTKGAVPVAAVGLVLSLCGKTISNFQYLVKFLIDFEERMTSVERLHEYGKSLESEDNHGNEPRMPHWPTEGAVEFRNVTMRYTTERDHVLHSVSFSIKSREKIGVVGRTGAGKSSLAACLFRLVELSEGSIIVDGEDISKLSLSCVRSKLSTIPQDPALFSGTIRYNIDPFAEYSDNEIWTAIGKVHMKDRILQFAKDLDYMVEDNGGNFSVGEKQLICLGRAILRKSKILLLDEATANIDTSTDAILQKTIRTCFADCTVITIAHRLNTVLHSDRIIVMDAGKVVECDSPQVLLANQNSFLSKMIDAQTVKTLSQRL